MKKHFLAQELPMADLERIGLAKDEELLLDEDNLEALLSGRVTSLLNFKGIDAGGFRIDRMEARLSLFRESDNGVALKMHPIFKELQAHPLLTDSELADMKSGLLESALVQVGKSPGQLHTLILEYDPLTKSIIEYDPGDVPAPKRVNGEELSEKQQRDFSHGKLIELSDGTKFQHRASEPKGIFSDRKALIFSVLLDGGISYLLLRGIQHFANSRSAQKDEHTAGFDRDFQLMSKQQEELKPRFTEVKVTNRGYSR